MSSEFDPRAVRRMGIYERRSIRVGIAQHGATAAACFVALVQLASVSTLSASLSVAVHLLSFAFPLTLVALSGYRWLSNRGHTSPLTDVSAGLCGVLGQLSAWGGLAAITAHFSYFALALFALASLASAIAFFWSAQGVDNATQSATIDRQ